MDIQERPDWQQRVFKEKEELDERLVKLQAFICSDFARNLPGQDYQLLNQQEQAMSLYSAVLDARIKRFEQ